MKQLREKYLKGALLKDPAIHEKVVNHVIKGVTEYGFNFQGVIESPILGTEGNKEFLAYFRYNYYFFIDKLDIIDILRTPLI